MVCMLKYSTQQYDSAFSHSHYHWDRSCFNPRRRFYLTLLPLPPSPKPKLILRHRLLIIRHILGWEWTSPSSARQYVCIYLPLNFRNNYYDFIVTTLMNIKSRRNNFSLSHHFAVREFIPHTVHTPRLMGEWNTEKREENKNSKHIIISSIEMGEYTFRCDGKNE